MKERPMLFNGAMVRAILDGRKTQTRRTMKPQPYFGKTAHGERYWMLDDAPGSCVGQMHWANLCKHGQPGDHLWVRETFQWVNESECVYRATDKEWGSMDNCTWNWKPSILMPRAASRITLEITNVRVERLNQISEADAIAEGVWQEYLEDKKDWSMCSQCGGTGIYDHHSLAGCSPDSDCFQCDTNKKRFKSLWESINGTCSFGEQWVWVIEFKQI